ncbi:MAG: hypothetical protein ACK4JE_05685, partial [Endomicrobiia bacterium]
MNRWIKNLLISSGLFIFLVLLDLFAVAPNFINYQGRIRKNGQPVSGTIPMEFKIYDNQTGGNQ